MPIIHHHAKINILVCVRGHPFDRTAFDAIFQDMEDISATMVDHPAAQALMNPEAMQHYDALVLYDMPGLDFEHATEKPGFIDPTPAFKQGFEALLQQGKPVVALHHALAGWPTWPEYGQWLGGRFLYRSGVINGDKKLDSGYAADITYTAQNIAPQHPVMAGIPATFPLCDELYLAEIFEDDVTPLLRSDYDFTAQNFYSATAALNGQMDNNSGWEHPEGSNLIGWTKKALNSPLVYLQIGDGSSAYENPYFRKILHNALTWVIGEKG
ncbi:MAG: ThuA domain-containing protein [Emcibacter sp.]|nr:ThuA domain-containing protein [Emcibacter sp.]